MNQLKMADIQSILLLKARRWSNRRIALELGIDRTTVGRYVRLALELAGEGVAEPAEEMDAGASGPAPVGIEKSAAESQGFSLREVTADPAQAPAGAALTGEACPAEPSSGVGPVGAAKSAKALAGESAAADGNGDEPASVGDGRPASKSATAPAGSGAIAFPADLVALAREVRLRDGRGGHSKCAAYRSTIEEMLAKGLNCQRIYQDLVADGFAGSVYSVRRFVAQLLEKTPEPFRRMECGAGEEAQVDFGTGVPVERDGKRRRTHVFRIVLSHSRKAYSEAVWRQDTESFLRCLENAFWYFGGVPRTLVIDNLRAAVTRADWYDPDIHPKLQSFCAHYGTAILPTKPRMPRHKGKVENSVGYVKKNGLKGRVFASLQAENDWLLQWEETIADRRIHGTTKRQVKQHFEAIERPTLLLLPTDRFPYFHEKKRTVHSDGHIEVEKAYYSAPPEYVGREVWVRWDTRLVRIFNCRMEQVALHTRYEPGRFQTDKRHLSDRKICLVEEGAEKLLIRASLVGPKTSAWAQAMFRNRGIEGIRVLLGLVHLTRQHTAAEIEAACDTALSLQLYRLRSIRKLIAHPSDKQQSLILMDEHPTVIRSLEEYGSLVHDVFNKEALS